MTATDNARGKDTDRPLLEHLGELRTCLFGMLASWFVATLIVIPFCPWLLGRLSYPVEKAGLAPDVFLRPMYLESGISVVLRLTLWGGIVLSLPLLLYFAMRFVFPGLTVRERFYVKAVGAGAGVMFFVGVSLGYFLTLPVAIRFAVGVNHWLGFEMEWTEMAEFVAFALKLLLVFGLVFELPILLLGLGLLGIVSSGTLVNIRRHVIVLVFVLAMVLTPPDPFSQILMALPLLLMYEVCIVIIRLREKKSA